MEQIQITIYIVDRDSSDNIIFCRIIGLFKYVKITDDNVNVIVTQDLLKIIREENLSDGTTSQFSQDYTS